MPAPQPFLAGQRLTAGQLNDAVEKTLDSVALAIGGVISTTSGTTELNVSQLALTGLNVSTANLYSFNFRGIFSQSQQFDEFVIRIRRDTPVTGALVSEWGMYQPLTVNGFLFSSWSDFVPAVSNPAVNYYLSMARASGSGTLTIYGQLNTQNRTGLAVRRVGYAGQSRIVT